MAGKTVDVVEMGDSSGNGMIVKIKLSSGRKIFAFATKNIYGGNWNLGPTWNYLITGDRLFLLDTGRRGSGPSLMEMISLAGFSAPELDCVILSHGHEDHDGGLSYVADRTGAKISAHEIYQYLIKPYPGKAPSSEKQNFPASCWRCPMAESFVRENCRDYHRERMGLAINGIEGPEYELSEAIKLFHTPGHSPDALTVVVDNEALLPGDTILPDITPHPTQERFYNLTKTILPEKYAKAQQIYGLQAYLRSIKEIKKLGGKFPGLLLLPGHRLFFEDRWQFVELESRVQDLFEHHIERCESIKRALKDGPRTAEEIAQKCFEQRLLEGYAMNLAINEVLSHLELMERSGDVVATSNMKFATKNSANFEPFIRSIMEQG